MRHHKRFFIQGAKTEVFVCICQQDWQKPENQICAEDVSSQVSHHPSSNVSVSVILAVDIDVSQCPQRPVIKTSIPWPPVEIVLLGDKRVSPGEDLGVVVHWCSALHSQWLSSHSVLRGVQLELFWQCTWSCRVCLLCSALLLVWLKWAGWPGDVVICRAVVWLWWWSSWACPPGLMYPVWKAISHGYKELHLNVLVWQSFFLVKCSLICI